MIPTVLEDRLFIVTVCIYVLSFFLCIYLFDVNCLFHGQLHNQTKKTDEYIKL